MALTMSGCGVPFEDIAKCRGISPKTLGKHFREELDTGKVRANVNVMQSLYRSAMEGNVTAMIFWLKTRAGWREHRGPAPGDSHEPVAPRADVELDRAITVELARHGLSREVAGVPEEPDAGSKAEAPIQMEGVARAA